MGAKFVTMAEIQAEKHRIEAEITETIRRFEVEAPGALIEEVRIGRRPERIDQRFGELFAELRIMVD